MKLKIVKIFTTLDGECTDGGPLQWSTFIRLGGCNLRCWKSSGFCDAPHSLDINGPYMEMTVEEIFEQVRNGPKRITITGGEPLLQQEAVIKLSQLLFFQGYTVSLETSGSILFHEELTKSAITIIMDLKPPSTEMVHKNCFENLGKLRHGDYIKCVIENREDFDWFIETIMTYGTMASLAVGPRFGEEGPMLNPAEIIDWLREHKLWHIRLNLQLHKYLWNCHPPAVDSLKEVNYTKLTEGEK